MTSTPSCAMDASLWDEPTTGIALYTQALSEALEREGVRVVRVGAARSGEFPRRTRSRTAFALAELPRVLAQAGAPVFHAVGNFNLPLVRVPGVKFVLTVHDLIPLMLPETASAAFRWQFRLWLSRSLQVADAVICVSERTREDLLARFEVPPSKIEVIHHGVDHLAHVPPPDATTTAYLDALGLRAPFVLYAGALDARKNVQLVLEACARLRRQGRPAPLVLAGQRWFGADKVEHRVAALRAEGVDIRALGYLEAPVFYSLMSRAAAFVFPSRYEGFGLPPLEAMWQGVPTIISDAGALPEVCGGAAAVVGVDDAEALAATLGRLLESPRERQVLAERGRAHARTFTWQRAAQATLEVYRRVGGT